MSKSLQKENLRCGFTTGTCATAAAKAAAVALLRQTPVQEIGINLPEGIEVGFSVNRCEFDKLRAFCCVVKDASDDPDVTRGAELCATVELRDQPGITVEAGEGVGIVTKPGLETPAGRPAINPVPLEMILSSVKEVSEGKGLRVTISVPQGKKLAQKTLNPRLGIEGGISILGTTGRVIPYSKEGYTASISSALSVAVACGCKQVVLTTGRRSEKFAQQEFDLPEEAFVQMADFVGFALEESVAKGLNKVILWGMIGKLSKLAAGIFYTHSEESAIDIDHLVEIARDCGVEEERCVLLQKAVTAHHFLKLLEEDKRSEVIARICLLAAEACWNQAGQSLQVEVILSDYQGKILGRVCVG